MEQFESIKSKERVKELGEVFTPDGIVKDMLGLVDEASIKDMGDNANGYQGYSYDLDKTFLEPSCGTGNFLVEIVARKCKTAVEKYKNSLQDDNAKEEFKVNLLKCVATVYGVDIMPDNIIESKRRVTEIIAKAYTKYIECEFESDETYNNVVKYIVDRNILLGNTLENTMAMNFDTSKVPAITFSGKVTEGTASELQFSEWNFDGEKVVRKAHLAADIDDNGTDGTYRKVHYTKLPTLKDKSLEMPL